MALLPRLNSRSDHFFFVTAIKRNSQPAIKKMAPSGVTGPTNFTALLSCIFRKLRRYNDPEKRMMPAMKLLPAHFIHLFLNFSTMMAMASNASA